MPPFAEFRRKSIFSWRGLEEDLFMFWKRYSTRYDVTIVKRPWIKMAAEAGALFYFWNLFLYFCKLRAGKFCYYLYMFWCIKCAPRNELSLKLEMKKVKSEILFLVCFGWMEEWGWVFRIFNKDWHVKIVAGMFSWLEK